MQCDFDRDIQILVISGGRGPERAGATLSGNSVLKALKLLEFNVELLNISSLGSTELKIIESKDLVFLTTHGWYGEDGKIQGVLDWMNIPYIGSGVMASANCYFKPTTNIIAEAAGLSVPPYRVTASNTCPKIEANYFSDLIGFPLFAKPASDGCSHRARIIGNSNQLMEWLNEINMDKSPFLVSRYIQGSDISVGLLEKNGNIDVLPILKTTVLNSKFYSTDVKRNSNMRVHECPLQVDIEIKNIIEKHARAVFVATNCKGLARVDFILDDKGHP